MDLLKLATEAHSTRSPILVIVVAASLVCDNLGYLQDLPAPARGAVHVLEVLCFLVLISQGIMWLWNLKHGRKPEEPRESKLQHLAPELRGVLKKFTDSKSLVAQLDSRGPVTLLMDMDLVSETSQPKEDRWKSYTVQRWVFDYLLEHPELLEGAIPPVEKVSIAFI